MTVTEDLRCNSDFSAELNNNNNNDTNNGWSTLQIDVSYNHDHCIGGIANLKIIYFNP